MGQNDYQGNSNEIEREEHGEVENANEILDNDVENMSDN